MINFSFIDKIMSVTSFKKLLMDNILKAFNISFKQTNDSFHWESEVNPDVIEYFKQREIILSEKTLNRLTGNLKYELLEGINNKESITEIKSRLDKIFIDMAPYEIERIARTETINAQNAGEFHAQVQSGVATHKSWAANIQNKRTGEDSKRLHGQVREISDEFVDWKTGKTCQHSPNRPNCRCSIHYHYEKPKTVKKHGMEYLA